MSRSCLKKFVGAATVAARGSLAWERKTDRVEPCPYISFDSICCRKLVRGRWPLNWFYAETLVQVMVQIVKVEDRTIDDQR